jgi:hypothetical protein
MDGSIEYALDAPWRMEPRGAPGDYTYDQVPIQFSFFDEAFAFGSSLRFGEVCSISVTEFINGEALPAATHLRESFRQIEVTRGGAADPELDDTTGPFDAARAYWEKLALPPWRGFCRPSTGEDCSALYSLNGSSEWHALIKHQPRDVEPGTRRTMKLTARITRSGYDCSIDRDDQISLTNWVNVLFAEAPLPRFGDDSGWVYGDLHYHSQGTDNEGEVGYNYRGTLQAMSAMGLDFAFATEHASDSQMIADMRFGLDVLGVRLEDSGSIIRGLRDMSPERFGDHAQLVRRIMNAAFDLSPLRSGAPPRLFVGGEVDVQPEIVLPASGNWVIHYGNNKGYDLTNLCGLGGVPGSLLEPCNEDLLLLRMSDDHWKVYDRQGLGDYEGARQHLIYLPQISEADTFVSSGTGKYGGGTRNLARLGDPIIDEIGSKSGIAFLAHPLSGAGSGTPGPDAVPYSPSQLAEVFAFPAYKGLQIWNDNDRLESSVEEFGYGYNTLGIPVLYEERIDPFHDPGALLYGRFELAPHAEADRVAWRYAEVKDRIEGALHDGAHTWDRQLLIGLDPARTAELDWLGPDEPRRIFMAGGSDAHGDLNYRREGYARWTTRVTDNALGKVRNLVDVGSLAEGEHDDLQGRVQEAVAEGRFSVTDGPALRIGIDRDGDGQLDPDEPGMGDVIELDENNEIVRGPTRGETLEPLRRGVPLLIEWDSTPEFGEVESIDLYVGVLLPDYGECFEDTCPESRIYAPINHGVRNSGNPGGEPIDAGETVGRLADGYWTNHEATLRIAGGDPTEVVRLDLNMFPAVASEPGTRFFIRAFARTRPSHPGCSDEARPEQRDDLTRRGVCLSRYAFTNPIWAVRPTPEREPEPWGRTVGSTRDEHAPRVALDAAGNMFVAGTFASSIYVGGPTLITADGRGVYVAKIDPDGQLLWVKKIDGGLDLAGGLAVTDDGDVIVTGSYTGTLKLDGDAQRTAAGSDAFVIRYSGADGAVEWWNVVAGDSDQYGVDVAVGPTGEVYVAGTFRGEVGEGWWTQIGDAGTDCFLARFTLDGALAWLRHAGGGAGSCRLSAVATNSRGDAILAGYTTGELVVDPWYPTNKTRQSDGGRDGFVVAFSRDTAYQWDVYLGGATGIGAGDASIYDIAVDGSDRVHLIGSTEGFLLVDDGDGLEAWDFNFNNSEVLVATLGADGEWDPSRYASWGGAGDEIGAGIDVADDGSACITGTFWSTQVSLGGTLLTRVGDREGFVARVDVDGNISWVDAYGRTGSSMGQSCALGASGQLAVSARYDGSLLFGTATVHAWGGWDGAYGLYP